MFSVFNQSKEIEMSCGCCVCLLLCSIVVVRLLITDTFSDRPAPVWHQLLDKELDISPAFLDALRVEQVTMKDPNGYSQSETVHACAWDEDAGTCGISAAAVVQLLERWNKPAADFHEHQYLCSTRGSESICVSSGCEWDGKECTVPSADYEELLQAFPYSYLSGLVHGSAIETARCGGIRNSSTCNADDFCYWHLKDEKCALDARRYHFELALQSSDLSGRFQHLQNACISNSDASGCLSIPDTEFKNIQNICHPSEEGLHEIDENKGLVSTEANNSDQFSTAVWLTARWVIRYLSTGILYYLPLVLVCFVLFFVFVQISVFSLVIVGVVWLVFLLAYVLVHLRRSDSLLPEKPTQSASGNLHLEARVVPQL